MMSNSVRVLLVEDDPAVLLGTQQTLQLAGFEVEPFADAEVGDHEHRSRCARDRRLRRQAPGDGRPGTSGAGAIDRQGSRRDSDYGPWRRRHGGECHAARRLRLRGKAVPAPPVGRNGDASGRKSPPHPPGQGAAGPARRSMRHRVVNSRQLARNPARATVRSRSGRSTRERPHSRRNGNRQGAHCPQPAPAQPAQREAVRRRQLRWRARTAVRERDVRLRGRRIHRGRRTAASERSSTPAAARCFSTRSRACRRHCRSSSCASCRSRKSSGWDRMN